MHGLKQFITSTFCILLIQSCFAQNQFEGVWQGINIPAGKKIEQGTIIFADFHISSDQLTGQTREEYSNTDFYAIKKIEGKLVENKLLIKQLVIKKKKTRSSLTWCMLKMELTYNDSTGYLEGKYTSTDCRRKAGRIILHRSTADFSDNEIPMLTQTWANYFKKDYKNGYNAPEIRAIELANFKFQPIYFDYDKDSIKPEFKPFLLSMIRMVNGHSDLRIMVTGHTDSDGTDEYNDDLSLRRANEIVNFFTSNGLQENRIIIEFKGESAPVDSNKTPEGKQKNRRVDFSFI